MSASEHYINALSNYAKSKRAIFGDADIEFAESEITAFEPKDIALMLHQLHLVATGDVDPALITIPITTRAEAKVRFASIFTCVIAHLAISEVTEINVWLKSFLEGSTMAGSTGGSECIYASMLANASPHIIEECVAIWRSLESDQRPDAGFPVSLALCAGAQYLFVLGPDIKKLLKEQRKLEVNVFSNDLSRLSSIEKYSFSTDQCKSFLKLAGAIGGALAGDALAGSAVGGIVGDIYCSSGSKSNAKDNPGTPAKPDKTDRPNPKAPKPEDELGMVMDPNELDYRTGMQDLHGKTSRSVYLRGAAVNNLSENFGNFNDALKKVSTLASLRASLLTLKPQMENIRVSRPATRLTPEVPESMTAPRMQRDHTESYELIDKSIPVPDTEGKTVAEIPNGYIVNFDAGSGAAMLHPNGISFPADFTEDAVRKAIARILEVAKVVLPVKI